MFYNALSLRVSRVPNFMLGSDERVEDVNGGAIFLYAHTAEIRGPKTASGDGGPYIFHRQFKFKDRDCSNKAWPAGSRPGDAREYVDTRH